METSKLGKARAGVFLLLIAISLYSLFMISASNTSYAAGQSLFKFKSLIGLSPSANSYDRQNFINNVSESLISSVSGGDVSVPARTRGVTRLAAFDEAEVASFLSSPRKTKFRRIVAAGSAAVGNDSRLAEGLLRLPFSNVSASLDTGLISQCINSIQEDLVTGERDVDAVLACIFNADAGGVLADASNNGGTGNPVDPFDNNASNGNGVNAGGANGGNGNGGANGNNGNGGANGNNGNGGANGNNGNGGANGNNGNGVNVFAVPEPSTYMLLGLGMITLVGFSRKRAKARIS